MKKILFRKILSDCLIFFLITLFFASLIIWIFQAVNFLDIMIEDGRDYIVYIKYTLLLCATISDLQQSQGSPGERLLPFTAGLKVAP